MDGWILIPIFLPVIAGAALLAFRRGTAGKNSDTGMEDGMSGKAQPESAGELKRLHLLVGAVLFVSALFALAAAWSGERQVTLFYLMADIPIYFRIDQVGALFVTFTSIVWVAVGVYSFVYMKHEGRERQFFGFYLLVYGVLVALDFSGNLVTLYMFYELMSLTSMPLVLHNRSREAVMAALKYLFYSMCGAYCGLFGIFFLYKYCDTLTFTAGGTLNLLLLGENGGLLLVAVFMMILGFGVKAGMLPMHAWLPTAHPVAPSPASAVLSGIIVKAGVLAVFRVIYYVVGPEFIRGTWVQTAWMSLALLTVFMGSLLAYREKVFKKRLAYSTVSQASYILFGLSLLSEAGVTGALLHSVFHAFIKSALFLTAGIFIFQCGKTRVEELRGIGKRMPKTLWCFTFAALALIGIPPASGFISKWYLAQGALEANVGVFGWLGPVVLLISALLTAGYLLPVRVRGFFPGSRAETSKEKAENELGAQAGQEDAEAVREHGGEPALGMLVPLAVMAALAVLLGLFPGALIEYAARIAVAVL